MSNGIDKTDDICFSRHREEGANMPTMSKIMDRQQVVNLFSDARSYGGEGLDSRFHTLLANDAALRSLNADLLGALKVLHGIVQNTFQGGYDIHGVKRPWLIQAEQAIARAEGK